ncbi:MAG: FAD-linked oxidase C-terminal domain-containing protein [Thermoleophilia bacterium]
MAATSTIDTLTDELTGALASERVTRGEALREQHARGEAYHPAALPDVVVFPESVEEVVAIVERCRARRVPIVPVGAGTSLEGNVNALHGGVSVDMTHMNRILRIGQEDLDVTVQAGVTRKQLNDRLRADGLFFPIDPGADATIGGMVGTRATGTTTVRYGGMRENVISLKVVTATGEVLQTASRARKSAAGYDLTRLFVGSEGTLGIVVEATLRLYGVPEAMGAAVCSVPSVDAAVQTVIQTIQLGVPVARMELLDEVQMDAIVRFSELPYAIAPTLFLEFHGTDASVEEAAATVAEIAQEHGGGDFQWSPDQTERNRLWQARHDSYYAALALRPGARAFATDVCLPISSMAGLIAETRADIDRSDLLAMVVGHVGDGNFHVMFLLDMDDEDEVARAKAVNDRMVRRAIELDGTCTGEHGVGYGKIPYLELERGPVGMALLGTIKQALDPDGIMNPGKVVPLAP